MATLVETTTGLTGVGLHTWAGANFDFYSWLIETYPSYVSSRQVATDRFVIWGGGIARPSLFNTPVNFNYPHTPIVLEHRVGGERDTVQPYFYPGKMSAIGFVIAPGFQLTLKLWNW